MISNDYLERVYAGVLGKLIGVYVGRPFEGWTHQRIMKELGPIEYYVHEQLNQPLVVTDDDVSGTFTFIRALEDYGVSPDLSAEDIGKSWLNYIIKERTILWWGGNGNSTEHTAWLNLSKGIPAPDSGSIATNGSTVAEQIGAQIFIDGWGMVAPGQPELAAQLAEKAGSVSHDGEAVYAAKLWAAMEASAFQINDIDELLNIGLAQIPADCLIRTLIADVRKWHRNNPDWLDTRQLIEDKYGYDKYPGNCHVVPNHAIMIMAVLYAPDDFQKSQMIINTAGWDTDCNAGNVGCLVGLMVGLDGLDAGPDWRGPLADRMLISSADGGNSINDAVRAAYYLVNLGLRLSGERALDAPKQGAQFHFSLPGSRQGFQDQGGHGTVPVKIDNVKFETSRALSASYVAIGPGQVAAIATPTFATPDVPDMRTYDLMATPLVYSGQTLKARVICPVSNIGAIDVCLRLGVYDCDDVMQSQDGPFVTLEPGAETTLEWRIPNFAGLPIATAGIAVSANGPRSDGHILVDYLRWDGTPELILRRPDGTGDFWRTAWVSGVSFFSKRFPPDFRISQDHGEGIVIHGTRQWTDYRVASDIVLHLGDYVGLAARVQGLRRYYAARLTRSGAFQIVRVRDDDTVVLAETPFPVHFEKTICTAISVQGQNITVSADEVVLHAVDDSDVAFKDGGIGLLVHEGAMSTDAVTVGSVS